MSSEKQETIIGDYIVKKTLGKGTFSKVKLGIHKVTNQKVAIKILEKSKIVEKDDLERIIREMDIIRQLNHPNIARVYEMCESDDFFFIMMEYCSGGELFNYIVKNQRLSEDETSYFFYQIINALEYIHSKNIAHRDLKPENLLLDENNLIKIIDFGLSNYFYGKKLSTPCGSPCYASPEMVSGKKYDGFLIDIWALGITLFAMMCGYLPFEDEDNDELFKKILECNLKFPTHLSKCAKDIMKKILVTDPKKRITIKDIKLHPFYLNGKDIFEERFFVLDDEDEDAFGKINKKRRNRLLDDDFGNRSFEITSDKCDIEKMIENYRNKNKNKTKNDDNENRKIDKDNKNNETRKEENKVDNTNNINNTNNTKIDVASGEVIEKNKVIENKNEKNIVKDIKKETIKINNNINHNNKEANNNEKNTNKQNEKNTINIKQPENEKLIINNQNEKTRNGKNHLKENSKDKKQNNSPKKYSQREGKKAINNIINTLTNQTITTPSITNRDTTYSNNITPQHHIRKQNYTNLTNPNTALTSQNTTNSNYPNNLYQHNVLNDYLNNGTLISKKNNRISRIPKITIVDHKKRKGISQHRTTNTTLNTKNTSLTKENPNSSLNNQYLNVNQGKGHSTVRTDFEIGELINISSNRNTNINHMNYNNINNDGPVHTVGNSNRGRFNFLKFKIKNDVPRKVPLVNNNIKGEKNEREKKSNGQKKILINNAILNLNNFPSSSREQQYSPQNKKLPSIINGHEKKNINKRFDFLSSNRVHLKTETNIVENNKIFGNNITSRIRESSKLRFNKPIRFNKLKLNDFIM